MILFSCKKEKRHFDKHGNEYIQKGDELFIVPAKYHKTGERYQIFMINETDSIVTIKHKFTLSPDEQRIFEFTDTDSLIFNIGPKIFFGEYGLETEDKKGQIAGIGGEFWEKYNVPDDVEYGFVIVPEGEGDIATE